MTTTRSIQIGISKEISQYYVDSILNIEDVTVNARLVWEAHREAKTESERKEAVEKLFKNSLVPREKHYIPSTMTEDELDRVQIRSTLFFEEGL